MSDSTNHARKKSPPKVALKNSSLIWLDGDVPLNAKSYEELPCNLFQVQPPRARRPLTLPEPPPKSWSPFYRRLFAFDPTPIYRRLNDSRALNPFQRHPKLSIKDLFESQQDMCACGCQQKIPQGRRRWASPECAKIGAAVCSIIRCFTAKTLSKLREKYIGGYHCEVCGLAGNRARGKKSQRITIELDHIYPVKYGGGGSWLSNYQLKCKSCHRSKTNRDFGFANKTNPPPEEKI